MKENTRGLRIRILGIEGIRIGKWPELRSVSIASCLRNFVNIESPEWTFLCIAWIEEVRRGGC